MGQARTHYILVGMDQGMLVGLTSPSAILVTQAARRALSRAHTSAESKQFP